MNTARTSARAVRRHNDYSNNAVLFEQAMGKVTDDIGKIINQKLIEPESDFKLRMITLGDCDYLFEVERYGFPLRYIAYSDKRRIVVGDTAEEIDVAI